VNQVDQVMLVHQDLLDLQEVMVLVADQETQEQKEI
jgi:hypothetical protein